MIVLVHLPSERTIILYHFFTVQDALPDHHGYRWNIMWQKCKGMGLNGFIFKNENKNININERKNPGGRLGFAC